MARTVERIQADLDALNAAKANPVKLAQMPDGRRVQYRDMDELLRRSLLQKRNCGRPAD